MRNPRVPLPASEPRASFLLYPLLLSSPRVILPTVAVVAAEEPDTAANSEHAATLTCSSLPGILVSQGISPLSRRVEIEEW